MCKYHFLQCFRCGREEYIKIMEPCEWAKNGEDPADAELLEKHIDECENNTKL